MTIEPKALEATSLHANHCPRCGVMNDYVNATGCFETMERGGGQE